MKKRHWRLWMLTWLVSLLMVGCSTSSSPGSGSTKQPSIVSFAATPSSLSAAGEVKLEWNVTGATSLELDQGIGTVTPLDAGSKTLVVSTSTTFKLTAKNANGTISATTNVKVVSPSTLGPGVWDQANWDEALWQ